MSFVGVPDFVVTILAYLHIISAMCWLGGAILFVAIVAPGLRRMKPAASLDFLATVVPHASRFFLMVATSTVIFGPCLLLTIPDYSPVIYVGLATGLAAYIDVLFTVRVFSKLSKTAQEMQKSGQAGPPSPEFLRQMKIGGMGTLSIVLLLVVTLVFMVFSGYPF